MPKISEYTDGGLVQATDQFVINRGGTNYRVTGLGLVVNAKASPYGALGDGSTDDYTALQAALNAIPSSGGTLFIPAGNYIVGTTLEIPVDRPVKIVGAGMKSTRIKLKNAANTVVMDFAGAVPASYTNPDNFDYLTISDLTIDGNKANNTTGTYGLVISFADYFVLDRISVINCKSQGARLLNCDEGTILNSFFTVNGSGGGQDGGIRLSSGTHDIAIIGCGIESNTGAGLSCGALAESSIIGNNFWSNTFDMDLNAVVNCVVAGNVCEAATSHGILLQATAVKNSIYGNQIFSCTTDGIRINDSMDNSIIGNVVNGVGGVGINERLTSDRNLITGNQLVSNTGGSVVKVGANSYVYANRGAAGTAVTGSRGGNAALASLLTALAAAGIITDSTSA